MAQRLGIIIFGATGYTGKVAVEKIVSLAGRSNLTWGVAGRSQDKLTEVLDDASKKTGANLKDIPIVVANINDEQSMKNMTKMCKVLVNCVGPYRHWGEQAVKACIETGTHHVDVSGEPEYMEKMQLLYHKEAEEKGIYVISACGFDSVPAEIGCLHFMEQFQGDVNSMESFLTLSSKGKQKGASINYATWECMVYGLAHAKDLGPLRKKLFPHRLPSMSPKLQNRGSVFRNPIGPGWAMPFLGSDQSVMRRSQYYFHEKMSRRPLQIQCYFTIPTFSNVLAFMFAGFFLVLLAKFEWGRKLLLAHPKFFTRGFVSHEGPLEESRKNTEFSITFVGNGWKAKNVDGIQNDSPPDTQVMTRISGSDPAYGLAAICVLACAITIIDDGHKMPGKGGVFSPGAAFYETSLISQLQENGVTMEVLDIVMKNKL